MRHKAIFAEPVGLINEAQGDLKETHFISLLPWAFTLLGYNLISGPSYLAILFRSFPYDYSSSTAAANYTATSANQRFFRQLSSDLKERRVPLGCPWLTIFI